MFARHFIDSLEFARNGRELRGEALLAEMPRLQDMLAAPEGNVGYIVRGLQGKDGKPMLELELGGSCQLRCQRCLGGLEYPVKLATRLLLVQESEPDESSIEENAPDSIMADKHLDVLGMIEEEILLSLPFAPKHSSGACHPVEGDLERSEPGEKPFAVLSGLKFR